MKERQFFIAILFIFLRILLQSLPVSSIKCHICTTALLDCEKKGECKNLKKSDRKCPSDKSLLECEEYGISEFKRWKKLGLTLPKGYEKFDEILDRLPDKFRKRRDEPENTFSNTTTEPETNYDYEIPSGVENRYLEAAQKFDRCLGVTINITEPNEHETNPTIIKLCGNKPGNGGFSQILKAHIGEDQIKYLNELVPNPGKCIIKKTAGNPTLICACNKNGCNTGEKRMRKEDSNSGNSILNRVNYFKIKLIGFIIVILAIPIFLLF